MATIKRDSTFKKNSYESAAWSDQKNVCGIDEVGRGCLAGPVVTAAVILRTKKLCRLIKDSKKMTAEEREKAYSWIVKNSWFGIGIVHHRLIDKINIYQATLHAMERAAMQLFSSVRVKPSIILVDAMPLQIPTFQGDIIAFPFGETKSISIAAASIIAKVTRDRLMVKLDSTIPGYEIARHKGYATAAHKRTIYECAPSIIHRKSFLSYTKTYEYQQTILESSESLNESAAEPVQVQKNLSEVYNGAP